MMNIPATTLCWSLKNFTLVLLFIFSDKIIISVLRPQISCAAVKKKSKIIYKEQQKKTGPAIEIFANLLLWLFELQPRYRPPNVNTSSFNDIISSCLKCLNARNLSLVIKYAFIAKCFASVNGFSVQKSMNSTLVNFLHLALHQPWWFKMHSVDLSRKLLLMYLSAIQFTALEQALGPTMFTLNVMLR